jgi:hypothetical protein
MAKKNIPDRKTIQNGFKWDLTPLMKDDSQWEKLYREVGERIIQYEYYKRQNLSRLKLFVKPWSLISACQGSLTGFTRTHTSEATRSRPTRQRLP